MILADLLMYKVYQCLTKLGRNKSDAKYSAVLFLSGLVSFFMINIIISTGILYENRLSQIFHKGDVLSYLAIGILVAIFFCVRYYKYRSLEDIEEKLSLTHPLKLKMLKILVILFSITIPIWFICLCYMNG